ncbi:class I tRNA ligase family protein, partial [Streptococcus suis]
NTLRGQIREAYDQYDCKGIDYSVVKLVTLDLSAFYLDFAKDVVYIDGAKSLSRRQMQTVFSDILVKITKLLTPFLP